ncbi:uncharacterized protein LOC130667730 [Microplitis mediator]|uniref:uncharacterized protein LOC130667730 n=1 Tax=Microplitis mediator TaxID=375433 RepID=UPI0025526262|nr:uncharacterized protein LOC130667730 [Microplitis mediator]
MSDEKNTNLTKFCDNELQNGGIQNYKAFIYDVTIKILFDGESIKSFYDVNEASMATIIGQIIHKYKKWGVASEIIMIDLIKRAEKLRPNRGSALNKPPPPLKWETILHAKGYYCGKEVIGELPIVYDCLSYMGLMEPLKSPLIPEPKHYSMVLNYSATFFLSPALQVAKPYYQARGFIHQNAPASNIDFRKFCNAIDYENPYNNDKVWEASLKQILILKNLKSGLNF